MTSTLALERKAATAPAPAIVDVDPDTGEVTALAAVTGVRDEVGDVIVPGALRRTLRERSPRLVVGHDWTRVAGRVTEAHELMPGDPRLPRTAPDGTPWPREAGALWIKARYVNTREGHDQREIARAFAEDMAYSIGYKVAEDGAKHRSGTRYISDLDLYEVSPVLHGANRLATQLSVKAAPVATTSTGAGALGTALAGTACSVCGAPAASSPGSVPTGLVLICPDCVAELDELTDGLASSADDDGDDGVLPAFDDLDNAPADVLYSRITCSVCTQTAGGRMTPIAGDLDWICPSCVRQVGELTDHLAAHAGDEHRAPTADAEYQDARTAEIPWTMLADGTLAAEGTGAAGIGPRAWGPQAGGRARP